MDKKQQLIVVLVGILCAGALVMYFFYDDIVPKPQVPVKVRNNIRFDVPDLTKKIQSENQEKTKKEMYDRSPTFNNKRYDSVANNLSFLQKVEKRNEEEREMGDLSKRRDNTNPFSKEREELQVLIDLQEDLKEGGNNNELEIVSSPVSSLPKAPVIQRPVKLMESAKYFHGAASGNGKNSPNSERILTPAEVVDQTIVYDNTLVAIRLKEDLVLKQQGLTIEEGTILYAKASVGGERLTLSVSSFIKEEKLYNISLNIYDFDGEPGLLVRNRAFFSIPSQITGDVYNASSQTYAQANTGFGAVGRVPLGTLAATSAASAVSQQLFTRPRARLPRKYHLWIDGQGADNEEEEGSSKGSKSPKSILNRLEAEIPPGLIQQAGSQFLNNQFSGGGMTPAQANQVR